MVVLILLNKSIKSTASVFLFISVLSIHITGNSSPSNSSLIRINPGRLSDVLFQWRYCIRLENLGDETVQLRERHWRIFSLSGTLETVRGRGIIGKVGHSSQRSFGGKVLGKAVF